MFAQLKTFAKTHRTEFVILLAILLVALFLRLYKIDGYMRFLGDEGRDALATLRIWREYDIPLIGPGTSVGNMYMGPLYYYMMFVPMFVTNFNPVSAAVMVAILGTVSVFLIYYIGRQFFHPIAGLVAGVLFAISYLPVNTSKSSWNPYPLPFFSLLVILSLYKITAERKPRWLIVLGVSLAFALQMHPLAMLLLPTTGIFWLLGLWNAKKEKQIKIFAKYTGIGMLLWCLLMSPLLLFDLKHSFMNARAFIAFFTHRDGTVSLNPFRRLVLAWEIFRDLYVTRFFTYSFPNIGRVVSILTPLFTVLFCVHLWKKRIPSTGFVLLLVWLTMGMIGLALVQSHVYDHYFGFVSPAIFLLFGACISMLWSYGRITQLVGVLLAVFMLIVAILGNPLRDTPGYQLQRTEKVAAFVLDQAGGKPFNFALIAKSNYDAGYKFFFNYWHKPSVIVDAQNLDATRTDQLFVVCEDIPCEPINNPIFEIAAWGYAKIDKIYDIAGLKVYRLVPAPKT